MRLLVTTQVVDLDDPMLGFFHQWLVLLAGRVETLEVICLKEGRHALPKNVRIHSLGKEKGRAGKLAYALRFYRALWRLRGRYDAAFVHMNPEYVVLAGWWWRMRGKRVVLWYTHRQVNMKLRLAAAFASAVATAAPESLRIKSKKIHVIGHGIDTAAFSAERDGSVHDPLRVVSVGRITPIKRLELLLEALAILARQGIRAELSLVGEPVYAADRAYEATLKAQAKELAITEALHFKGAVPYQAMPAVYAGADLSVNLAPTGGIDKAVLESMAAGAIPLVANRAFEPLLGGDAGRLVFAPGGDDLAAKIAALVALPRAERLALIERLVQAATTEADLAGVVERLAALITQA